MNAEFTLPIQFFKCQMQKCARKKQQHTFATQKLKFEQKPIIRIKRSKIDRKNASESFYFGIIPTEIMIIFFSRKKCVCKMRHLKKYLMKLK